MATEAAQHRTHLSKSRTKVSLKNWKTIAIVSLSLNVVIAFGIGVYCLLPVTVSSEEREFARYDRAIREIAAVCEPSTLTNVLSQFDKGSIYDSTGKKMVRGWIQYNCDLINGNADNYETGLNTYLKTQSLPTIDQLAKHKKQ